VAISFWTYLLHCRGGAFYVGHTDALEYRIAQHETGAIPGFTRDHLPVKLVWSEVFPTREEALTMEQAQGLEPHQEDGADPRRLERDQPSRAP